MCKDIEDMREIERDGEEEGEDDVRWKRGATKRDRAETTSGWGIIANKKDTARLLVEETNRTKKTGFF